MRLIIDREGLRLFAKQFISVSVMRIIYDYIYYSQVSTIYRYSGFRFDFGPGRWIVSWLMMYSLLPFAVRCLRNPCFSNITLYFLYLLSFIPATVLVAYMDLSYTPYLYIYYLILFAFSFNFRPRISRHYMTKESIYFLAGMLSLIVVFIWLYYAHGRIHLGLDDVYSIRLESRGYNMPMILRYIFASMKIVLPIFVVWAIKKRNTGIALIFGAAQLLSFFIDGSKSTLFSLIVSVAGVYFLKNHEERIAYIPDALSCIGLLAIAEYKLKNTFVIMYLFIRRVMFVPQLLNSRYYSFFTENEPDYFRSTILRLLGFTSPYGNIGRMIGRVVLDSDDLAANNGLFSDAIAHLGIAGVFIMPLAVLLLLKLLDMVSYDLEMDSLIGAVVPFFVALVSAHYFTLFMTHGVVALFLVFYFIPREKQVTRLRKSG